MNQVRSNTAPADIHDPTPHTTPRTPASAAPATATHYADPLAVLERQLLARPDSHGHHHHHRHPTACTRVAGHLAAPPTSGALDTSRTPSPEPTPAARRCMAATEAWMPVTEASPGNGRACPGAIERRNSWDGQAYRHAMMLKGAYFVGSCHPSEHAPTHNWHARHHEISVPPQNGYDADRGFSEGH